MHKGVILLVKADDRDGAIGEAEQFLEPYGDGDVWDWYVVGGRWSGTLNAKTKEFFEKAEAHFKAAYPDNKNPFLTQNMVNEQADALQKIWTDMGETSKNPYSRDQYKDRTGDDDALPLSECLSVVKEWTKDTDAEAEEMFTKMLAAREEEKENSGKYNTMSAYYAGIYKDLKYDSFSFESNVYDTVNGTNNPSEAIDNPDGWYAVMIDMHN